VKIGITIENLSPHRGGAEVYTLWLVRRLAAAGHDVTVLAEKCGYADVKFVQVPVNGIGRAWRALSFARNACRLLERGGYDVTLDMGRSYGGRFYMTHNGCLPATERARCMADPNPFSRALRRLASPLSPRKQVFAWIERERARRGTRLIALSQMVADQWRQHYGVPDDRIRVVHNGVDIAKFRPGGPKPPGSPLTILCVANNFQLKGVHHLLRAVQRLKGAVPGAFRVQIVGLGFGSGPRCQRMAETLGVADVVEFVGATDKIAEVYAAADVFCMPTFYDSCSLVLLEALAAGLPVVTTRFNGAGELLTSGTEGFILDDPRDETALAGALAGLFDVLVRERMSAAARALAERCTSERNFEEVCAVLAEGCAGRR
jgi:UDP-glucose:(heptosyl)LPS alpha-1,3-glucosyltransferase